MKAALLRHLAALKRWGIDVFALRTALSEFRRVRNERHEFERQRLSDRDGMSWPEGPAYTIYGEASQAAGQATGQYFHQDLLVAREIFRRNPRRHIDVGSSIYGFVAHVASFRDIEVLDIRPVDTPVDGITFVEHDLMSLSPSFTEVADSVSCLHALEHFGLGRYGDPVQFDGWRLGLEGLARMLEPSGTLYLAVPTGEPQRVEFNAHRVFSLPYLRNALEERFDIESLHFVDDSGTLTRDIDPYGTAAQHSMSATFGLSIWILHKR